LRFNSRLAAEDPVERALGVGGGLHLVAWAGAAFGNWHTFQGVLNVFAAALPGWLVAGGAGDLMAHGGYLSTDAAALSKFAADSIVG